MEYGVIYIKVCPPLGSPFEWIRYCYLFELASKSVKDNIAHIVNHINTKYANDIVIPMDMMIHPGCTTKPDKVEEIATEMYNEFVKFADRQGIPDCVRCAYAIGELSDIDVESTHKLGYDKVMLRLGRFLDESDDPGIYKI